MTMEHPPEQFEKLTTLLKLKRYESPPPGYFLRFSSQVMARIEALSEDQPSWLKRFWLAFEARPSVAASCGVLLGALLVTGFMLTQQSQGEAFVWESSVSPILGQATAHVDLDTSAQASLLVIPHAFSNALAPAFIFGDNRLRATTLDHWK